VICTTTQNCSAFTLQSKACFITTATQVLLRNKTLGLKIWYNPERFQVTIEESMGEVR